MKKITALFIAFYFISINTNGQNLYTECDLVPSSTVLCDLGAIDGFTGTMFTDNSPGPQPNPLCPDGGAPHNIGWMGFIAPDGDYDIKITFDNCVTDTFPNSGIQYGIYTNCTFTESIVCQADCNIEDINLSSDLFVPGQDYYLFLDGCFGTSCEFTFEVIGTYDTETKIFGRTFLDINNNGTQNSSEPGLDNVNITLNPGNITILTDENGNFKFSDVPGGEYTLTATISEGEWQEDVIVKDIPFVNSCEKIEIAFVPIEGVLPDVSFSITNSIARCDWEATFYLTISNNSLDPFEGTFQFEFDELTDFISSDIPDFWLNGNVLNGSIDQIGSFEELDFIVKLQMPSGSAILPNLDFKGTIIDGAGIELNQYSYSDQLRCSYDPNDKKEHPDRPGDENLTLMDEDIEYKIRFQNNGNDTAFLVRIVDELDPSIDPTSIRVINSSHPVETIIQNTTLEFLFEDILLVDSTTNYDASQGFVTFICNTKEGLAENTPVTNQAAIIFDTNDPIITNTTLNTLVSELCQDVNSEIDVSICDGEEFNGFDETGTYTVSIPIEFGCDSIVVIHLDVQGITYSAQNLEVCAGQEFEINGSEYILFESQEISDTLLNPQGCISSVFNYTVDVIQSQTIQLDTTICNGAEYLGFEEAGDYTVNTFDSETGCEVIINLTLEVQEIANIEEEYVFCGDGAFEINGTEYFIFESQEIFDTSYTAQGCINKIFQYDVTLIPTLEVEIDTFICEGMDYDGFTEPGSYNYITTDTLTGCNIVNLLDLEVLPLSDPACLVNTQDLVGLEIKIYPNPATHVIHLEGEKSFESIAIYSSNFHKVKDVNMTHPKKEIQVSTEGLSSGLYILAIQSDEQLSYKKVIIQ